MQIFIISYTTESHKRELFEQACIYLLYWPEILTNELAK